MEKIWIIALIIMVLLVAGCTDIPTPTNGSDDNNAQSNGNDVNALANDNNSSGGLSNLDEMKKVKIGDNISVHYTGKLENGEVFDSSEGREPLTFNAGAGQMIKGFDDAVIEMKVGDKKTITLAPSEAYGETNPALIQDFNKEVFVDFPEIKEGMVVSATNGAQGTVIEVDGNTVKVDFNPKLAGKTLIFDLELVSIN